MIARSMQRRTVAAAAPATAGRLAADLRARYVAALRSPPPLWILAAVLFLADLAVALAGAHSTALSALALIAPGWALTPLLPRALRACPLAAFVAAPALGVATITTVLITVARVGIRLDAVSVRVALAVLLAVALPLWDGPARRRGPTLAGVVEMLGLAGVVALSLVLSLRVAGSQIQPGNDWAKYLLYADQVREHGFLLIRNPYWMLGQPFRDDPGVPALYGATLILSRAAAGTLVHGIVVFAVLEVLTVYAFVRAYWGAAAGVLAAALVAVVPASQDILGWYGLANLVALVLLALLVSRARRRRVFLEGLGVAAVTLIGGAGVIADLYTREKSFGGSLPYTDYLTTKLDASLALRDISPMLAVAAAVAIVVVAFWYRRDGALWGPIALLVVAAALAWAWVAHIPNYYARMVFYVPLAVAPLAAVVAVRLRPRALVALAAAAGIALTAQSAYSETSSIRSYYTFVTPASLRGLDALSAVLRPNEVVVTDRCWSFLATWLLHTRTLAALEPQDIQPAAELPFAQEAHEIIDATPRGRTLARKLGVRYLVVDPVCPGSNGAPLPPPAWGTPVYESSRLAILRLPRRL
jgi:hypothetical protein